MIHTEKSIGIGTAILLSGVLVLSTACRHTSQQAPSPDDGASAAGGEGEEVQVGYGTQKQEDVTGAVASLDSETIASHRAARLEELIRGKFAGVEVVRRADGMMSLRIRGMGSLSGRDEPLVILDGSPVRERAIGLVLSALDPQEIDRIDVLKDVASTSIYGARGSNGVILIKTKRKH